MTRQAANGTASASSANTALPVAMIAFLTTFKPGYLEPMTEKVIGWVILVFAALMVALGAYCIRRIVDIKV